MTSTEGFEQAIEASHRALDEIARGNPDAFFDLYSRCDDATLANPYGPPARGWSAIEEAGRRAAANYRDGRAIEFENFAKCLTDDLGYVLEIERFETQVAGSDTVRPVALRVTSIFRPEGRAWKLLHRHADPIRPLGQATPSSQRRHAAHPRGGQRRRPWPASAATRSGERRCLTVTPKLPCKALDADPNRSAAL